MTSSSIHESPSVCAGSSSTLKKRLEHRELAKERKRAEPSLSKILTRIDIVLLLQPLSFFVRDFPVVGPGPEDAAAAVEHLAGLCTRSLSIVKYRRRSIPRTSFAGTFLSVLLAKP